MKDVKEQLVIYFVLIPQARGYIQPVKHEMAGDPGPSSL